MSYLDWIVIGGALLLIGTIIVSWIASYRAPKAGTFGSIKWFAFPMWVQISGGLIITALLAYLGYILWIPFPLTMPVGVLVVLRLVGLVLFLGGAILVFWARRSLGVMHGVSTSTTVQLQARHQLIRRGPYAAHVPMFVPSGVWQQIDRRAKKQ